MSDEQVKEQLKVLEKATKEGTTSKRKALETLKQSGILTKSGKLAKRYGG